MALLFLKPLINEWNPNPCIIWPPSPSPAVHLLGGFPSFPLLQAFGFLLPTSFPHMPKQIPSWEIDPSYSLILEYSFPKILLCQLPCLLHQSKFPSSECPPWTPYQINHPPPCLMTSYLLPTTLLWFLHTTHPSLEVFTVVPTYLQFCCLVSATRNQQRS